MCNSNSKKLLNRTFYGVTLIGKISRFPKNDRKLISSSLRIIFVSVNVTLPDWELTTQSSVQGFWTVWNWTFMRMLSQSQKVEALPRITAKKRLAILQSKLYISMRQHQNTTLTKTTPVIYFIPQMLNNSLDTEQNLKWRTHKA